MDDLDGVQVIAFADGEEFENWLAEHHARQEGVWIKLAKKKSGIPTVTDDELVDIGLCYGWISGQRRSLDDRYYLQKYVPRRPRSLWSRVNVDKVGPCACSRRERARADPRSRPGSGPDRGGTPSGPASPWGSRA